MRRLSFALLIFFTSCTPSSLSPTELTAEPEISAPIREDVEETQEIVPPKEEAATEVSPVITEQNELFKRYPPSELSLNGPWFLYYDTFSMKMIVMNQDGTGRTEMDLPQPLPSGIEIEGSPTKGLFAYISGDSDQSSPDLDLVIVELPGGEIYDRIPLIEPGWFDKELPTEVEHKELYLSDVIQSITEYGSFEWSSDGRYLAYVGATEGPSGDVYVYDTDNNDSLRLTTGSGQAALLSWSPGSKWIAHLAINTFCCGAGWNVDALWVVNPTGTKIEQVIPGGEMFFIQKWLGEQSFIITTWTAAFGSENLWTVNITDKDKTMFFDAPLKKRAFESGGNVVALYLEENGAKDYGVVPGLYIQPRFGGAPILIRAGVEPLSIDFSDEEDRFVAGLPEETILFTRYGTGEERISAGGSALVSPDGKWIAIYGNGENTLPGAQVYSFSDHSLNLLTGFPVRDLFWGLDSKGLFVTLGSYKLIYIPIDSSELIIVDDVFSPFGGDKTWVGG
jgi:hypothetical protein